MRNATDYFYRDSADIYEVISDGGYDAKETRSFIRTIKCDIQPFTGDMTSGERGYESVEKIRLFCAADDKIERGKYVVTADAQYIVTDVKRWRMGYEIIAERRDAL